MTAEGNAMNREQERSQQGPFNIVLGIGIGVFLVLLIWQRWEAIAAFWTN
jgi:hypothetical protein